MSQSPRTALYCRFAYADSPQEIQEQKRLLLDFCSARGLANPVFYIDSGVSGLTMERPAFSSLMEDIRSGLVSTVVARDASRICRLASVRDEYLHNIFPSYHVAFLEAAARPEASLMEILLSSRQDGSQQDGEGQK